MEIQNILEEKDIRSFKDCAVFNLYTTRNEWTTYNGDTAIQNRSNCHVCLSLESAEEKAEFQRNQGTKFIIDEVPVMCIESESGRLVITELFAPYPLESFSEAVSIFRKTNEVKDILYWAPDEKWTVRSFHDNSECVAPEQDAYCRRTSSAGKGKNHLAWSLKPYIVHDKYITLSVHNFRKLLLPDLC